MPRRRSEVRSADSLNDTERQLYEAIPPQLRENFLRLLPPAPRGDRKKAARIREHSKFLSGIVHSLDSHVKDLERLARAVELGATQKVDLRETLSPPALAGLSMRFTRPPRADRGASGGGTATAAAASAPAPSRRVGRPRKSS